MLWIPVTLAAATCQILRTSRQHELRCVLSTSAAGFVRYAYGAPLALVTSAMVFGLLGRPIPHIPGRFWPTVIGAGVAQIVATVALLQSFKMRDFAVGTVYSKSEVLIVAGMGAVGLGTAIEPAGWLGIVLVTVGVVALASQGSWRTVLQASGLQASRLQASGDPAALMGIVAAAGFAAAAVGIGSASKSLTGAASFDRALCTLTVMLTVQTLINAAWFAVADPRQIRLVAAAWRPAMWVGVFSLLGSIGWAWGFTLESAAKVRTLGQVELVIAFVIARVTLGERHRRADYLASALVLAGVVVVTVLG